MEAVKLDDNTYAFYFYVPRHEIVYLQSIIELYEGLGTLRTIDIKKNLMCLITTTEQVKSVKEMLNANKSEINFRVAKKSDISEYDYLESYGSKKLC